MTPALRNNRFAPDSPATLLAKLELFNPYSIKDRAVREMIRAAEEDGSLRSGGEIVEATSGNTGMAIAMVCAARGYRAVLVMSAIQSIERRQVLKALGAELVLTPKEGGTKAARVEAKRIAKERGAFYIGQHDNPANPLAHDGLADVAISLGVSQSGRVLRDFLYQGFNEDTGWMHTSSSVDNIDEFVETVIENEEGLFYEYGDELRPAARYNVQLIEKGPALESLIEKAVQADGKHRADEEHRTDEENHRDG